MIVFVSLNTYQHLCRQIPVRLLRTDDNLPPGRPIKFSELGRPLTYQEKYKIKKWRKQGVSEMTIKRRIVEANDNAPDFTR